MKNSRKMVLDKIISLIVNGTFQAGQKIYSENQLSNILDVKRSIVREVLVSLEIMGVVESRRGEGTFLKETDITTDFNPLNLVVLLEQADIKNLTQTRYILEPQIVGICTQVISDEKIEELRVCTKSMRASKDSLSSAKADMEFHNMISEATGNEVLSAIMRQLIIYFNLMTISNWKALHKPGFEKYKSLTCAQHEKIFCYIEKRDKERAMKAMSDHLQWMETVSPQLEYD
ncbi:FadR family transcriptional regulator [Christensenellaceae bacterium OttesenSCG-928-M15]|nr:FadR family transcriptional regulator [Christensenellaceae bacterium OttesenSCG-928-M15]